MDVPELTPDLVQMIADQSDAQSGQRSIRDRLNGASEPVRSQRVRVVHRPEQ